MSRLVLWKAKIFHLESFQGLLHVLAFLLALVWGLFLILIPSFLGHPVWNKGIRYPHPEGICPFLTGSVRTWSSGIPSIMGGYREYSRKSEVPPPHLCLPGGQSWVMEPPL